MTYITMCLRIWTLVSSQDPAASRAKYTQLCGFNTRMPWPSNLHCLDIDYSSQASSFQFFIRIFSAFWIIHVSFHSFKGLVSFRDPHSISTVPKIQERSLLTFFQYRPKKQRFESIISSHDANNLDCIWLNDGRLSRCGRYLPESWSVSSSENKINQPMMLVSDILQNYITILKTSK